MSEKALIYLDEPMQHRYLVVYEAAGISSDFLSYLIRSLLSEGRIRYVTVEKVGDQFQSREIVLEGPTGFLTTTTRVSLHPENETRMASIPINDTPAQTERVMYALALDAEEGSPEADCQEDLEPWHALQRWLEGAEHRVVIPFASALAEYTPPVAVRLRRDLATVFNLIRAHAILNQANRDRDPSGQIIATNEDYAEVHELIADLIGEGVEMSVPDTVRGTVAAVKELLKGKAYGSVTYTEVAKYLGLDKSTAKRRAYQAVKAGYLINDETRKGRTAQLILGDDLPEEQVVLPPPEALQVKGFAMSGCAVAADSGGTTPLSSSHEEREHFNL